MRPLTAGSIALALGLLVFGCGRDKARTEIAPKAAVQDDAAHKKMERAAGEFAGQEPAAAQAQPEPEQPAKKPAVPRRIKYTADLKLITDEFDKAKQGLETQVREHQGYEAYADVQSSPGAPRVGQWKVRVPIEKFAAFRAAVRELGETLSDTLNTEDLTKQYYDLEANIKNLRAEQESWRDMLKKTSDKVENLIAIKRELDRVTDEIQRKEGRLRLIANLTDLTTVNIQIRERQKYVPVKGPDAVEDPTFAMRAGKTFGSSWDALVSFGQAILLFLIALAPWLPLVLAGGILLIVLQRRRSKAATPIVGQPPPLGRV